jgi:hypothetical protein
MVIATFRVQEITFLDPGIMLLARRTMFLGPLFQATPGTSNPTNTRILQIRETPSKTRNTSNGRRSYTRSRNRNTRGCSRGRNRNINN